MTPNRFKRPVDKILGTEAPLQRIHRLIELSARAADFGSNLFRSQASIIVFTIVLTIVIIAHGDTPIVPAETVPRS